MTLSTEIAPNTSMPMDASLAPQRVAKVGAVSVVLDRRRKELRWERAKSDAMHLDIAVSLAVAQGLIRATSISNAGVVAQIARSAGYVTRIWRTEDNLVCVQTVGQFSGCTYSWTDAEVLRVTDALLYGVRVLGGWR